MPDVLLVRIYAAPRVSILVERCVSVIELVFRHNCVFKLIDEAGIGSAL